MADQPLPKPSTPPATPQPPAVPASNPSPAPVPTAPKPVPQPSAPKPAVPTPPPSPAPQPVPPAAPSAPQSISAPPPMAPTPSTPTPPAPSTPPTPSTPPPLPRPPISTANATNTPPPPQQTQTPPPMAPRPMTPPPASPAAPQRPQQAQSPQSSQSPQTPQSPQVRQTPPPPQPAKAGGSKLKFLPLIIGAVILVGALLFAAFRFLNPSGSPTPADGDPAAGTPVKQTVISYWGLWEPSSVLDEVFNEFSQQNPGVLVQYQKQSPIQYRERLQAAIASGTGPDVFRFHASWVPMLRTELTVMPSSVMKASEFESTFYPIATKQLKTGDQIVGVPLMYDGLGLYYNTQIFQTAGLQPPTTWAELSEAAQNLTIRNGNAIERSGAALGTATNVEHFSDILGLLMIQNGADPADPTSNEAVQALTFYTNFASRYKVWDETLPSSTVAFARGDVAMMLAPSWRAHEVLAMNPDLQFAIVPVPKLAGEQIGWASFWAEGVSSQSKNKDISWKLLKYLSSREVQQKLYSNAKQTRAFGEIYSRQDLASELINEPYVGAYLNDAPYAQTWYLNSYTHDNGLNDQIIKYYEDAVTAVTTGGKTIVSALETVAQGTTVVLRQFGLASQAPASTGTPL